MFFFIQNNVPIKLMSKGKRSFSDGDNKAIKKLRKEDGPQTEVLVRIGDKTVTRGEISSLKPGSWIDGQIINAYLSLIERRSQAEHLPSVCCLDVSFVDIMRVAGSQAAKDVFKTAHIADYEIILIPFMVAGVHWCLTAVDVPKKEVSFYNSIEGKYDDVEAFNLMQAFVADEVNDFDRWKFSKVSERPLQDGDNDCGVFVMTFADQISQRKALALKMKDIETIREKITMNILNNKITN